MLVRLLHVDLVVYISAMDAEGHRRVTRMNRRHLAWIIILNRRRGIHRLGRGCRCIAGSPAQPRWQGDFARWIRRLLRRVMVATRGRFSAYRGIHDAAIPDVRHL